MRLDVLAARVRALPRARSIGAACALALVVAVALAAFVATRDTRVALFASPLRGDQLAEVETRLAAWGVAYVPANDNVRVPRAKRAELLLRLALAGVPRAHLAGSAEALAHAGALTPQAVLEAQTRDALAADLALALRGVDGIVDARIVIAPSAAGVYADEPRRDASAAVRLTLAGGARLDPRAVAGIKAFVAHGVPGLDAERVAVLDDRGVVADDGDADASDVQAALQSALDAAFGAGATIVRVHREPLGERRDVHDVRRAVLGGSIARASTDEHYVSGTKRYAKSTANEDRGASTRDERRVALPGATARLGVAVFVDAARALDLEKIRALAAAAAGVRADRGDVLTVEAVAFADDPGGAATRASAPPAWAAWIAVALPHAIIALAIIVAAVVAARPLARVAARALDAAVSRRAVRDASTIAPARLREMLRDEPPHVAAAVIAALPAADAASVLETYEGDERAAIVRRLPTARTALLPSAEELLRER